MKTIKMDSGYVGTYDDELKPGDLVTAPWDGYYEFIKFEDRSQREKYSSPFPLAHVRQVYTVNGKRRKGYVKQCDAVYCQKAGDALAKTITLLEEEIGRLQKIKNSI